VPLDESEGIVKRHYTGIGARAPKIQVAFAAFGENYDGYTAPGCSPDTALYFTGQDQFTMNGLYDFPFREYEPNQGRWISPDPAGLKAVNPMNPQSWNRYAYVSNSPLNLTDPTGLIVSDCGWSGGCNGMVVDGYQSNVSTALGWGQSIAPCPGNVCQYWDGHQWMFFGAWADGSSGYLNWKLSQSGWSAQDLENFWNAANNFYNTHTQVAYSNLSKDQQKAANAFASDLGVDPSTIPWFTDNSCTSGECSLYFAIQNGFDLLNGELNPGQDPDPSVFHSPYDQSYRDALDQNSVHALTLPENVMDIWGIDTAFGTVHLDSWNWNTNPFQHAAQVICGIFGGSC
jgi:RHS repeat-associated protein